MNTSPTVLSLLETVFVSSSDDVQVQAQAVCDDQIFPEGCDMHTGCHFV